MDFVKRGWWWLQRYGVGLWLAWTLLQPELETFKEIWKVARGITAEMFALAVAVGAAIFFTVRFLAQRYPVLNDTVWSLLEPAAERAAPHVVRALRRSWPFVSKAAGFVWRPIWYVLSAIGRAIWRVLTLVGHGFLFLGRQVLRLIPEGVLRWMHGGANRVADAADRHVYGDDDDSDDGGRRRRSDPLNLVDSRFFMVALYASVFLGVNEDVNVPGEAFWKLALKVGLLLFVILVMGLTYRMVLSIFLLECFLWWVAMTEGAKVGTVYSLLFGAAYLLWLGYRRHILKERPRSVFFDDEEDDDDPPRRRDDN